MIRLAAGAAGFFHLDPIRRPTRPIRPIAALGDDTLQTHAASVLERERAVTVQMFR
jgi:hypothetical protein